MLLPELTEVDESPDEARCSHLRSCLMAITRGPLSLAAGLKVGRGIWGVGDGFSVTFPFLTMGPAPVTHSCRDLLPLLQPG